MDQNHMAESVRGRNRTDGSKMVSMDPFRNFDLAEMNKKETKNVC